MQVHARFFVQSITRHSYSPGTAAVTLAPVTRGAHNKQWATATPAGRIEMNIASEGASSFFADRLGREIAITFEEAPVEE